ncbi:MAG: VacJ family lipoprotein [Dissulfuribacterales bacterium]
MIYLNQKSLKLIALSICCILLQTVSPVKGAAVEQEKLSFDEDYTEKSLADPIEPVNRFMFQFNDKFYFYLLKPVAQGYSFILPEPIRISVSNFFSNLGFPVRFLNATLQLRFKDAGNEFSRFCINTIYGVGGLFDPAKEYWEIPQKDEDFGQTLGHYGVGQGFYLVLPIFGPSSLRDGVGLVADTFTDPLTYYLNWETNVAERGVSMVNHTSLHIGEYENIKKEALDPYILIKEAWTQRRDALIKE